MTDDGTQQVVPFFGVKDGDSSNQCQDLIVGAYGDMKLFDSNLKEMQDSQKNDKTIARNDLTFHLPADGQAYRPVANGFHAPNGLQFEAGVQKYKPASPQVSGKPYNASIPDQVTTIKLDKGSAVQILNSNANCSYVGRPRDVSVVPLPSGNGGIPGLTSDDVRHSLQQNPYSDVCILDGNTPGGVVNVNGSHNFVLKSAGSRVGANGALATALGVGLGLYFASSGPVQTNASDRQKPTRRNPEKQMKAPTFIR